MGQKVSREGNSTQVTRPRTFSASDDASPEALESGGSSHQMRPRSYSTSVTSNGLFAPPRNFAGFYAAVPLNSNIKCPICSKTVIPEDIEIHLVMCLTRPRINYNEERLTEDKGEECVICLEELNQGDFCARLPCLCLYHKDCIDKWFQINRSCPEHPS